ncbi:hypothetical protein IAD21_04751 [Abditibacteriota bacterium]|nr:hypothetical protein IAD21_04751 [Abditibacteriota bacterium]
MDFKGEFETHVTLALAGQEEFESLSHWSHKRNLKCTHIVLDRGVTASQPMLTLESRGTLESTLQQAEALRHDCEKAGFQVSRVKLEVAPWNPDVPSTSAKARPQERYFEHHIKLLLSSAANLSPLNAAITGHGAHLSRNARRTRDDGQQERFVTQRCYGVGRQEARDAFDALMQAIRALSVPIVETEEEYVVYDSNLALDAGWLEETQPPL